MRYNKKPLSVHAQIQLLKDRGLLFKDESAAIELLQKISYFRIAGYLRPMEEDKSTHRFKPHSYFENAVQLYNFDKELHNILFQAIRRIEITFRSKLINTISLQYDDAFWFMQTPLFEDKTYFARHIEIIQKEVKRSSEDFIQEHFKRYATPELPPVWKTLEVVSFGTLSKVFQNFNNKKLKKAIAREFALPQNLYLESWISSIVVLRNYIAHHARLWNRLFPIPPCLPKYLNTGDWIETKDMSPHKLFAILSCIYYLLQAIEPNNHFKEDLLALFAAYPNIDLRAMGFPENWREFPLWK